VPLLSAWRCARNRVCLDGVAEVGGSIGFEFARVGEREGKGGV
jgi:hypothetical protein